ncbi:DUF6959 family protein [Nocardia sp. NPDC101769]|uniref:DUF6959 family protein n=1 Tax=Nocardia sp. NPDC101769 TaxID=3364333 RepID=UPI003809DA7F
MEYQAQILDTQGNYSLVKWEGRKFPGLSIQGDSLHILREVLEEAELELTRGRVADALFAVGEALETVTGMDLSYREMMEKRGLGLPYPQSTDPGFGLVSAPEAR